MNAPEPPASRAAFHAALAALQAELTFSMPLAEALPLLPRHGLCWYLLPGDTDDGHELRLCHKDGHQVLTFAESFADLPLAFAGLIGMPAVLITAGIVAGRFSEALDNATTEPTEPTEPADPTEPAAAASATIEAGAPTAADTAAASLAEATDGVVVSGAEPEPTEPELAEDPSHSTEPLSEADRATTLDMVKAMAPETRKAFTIAFRDCFNVSREARAVAPLITEERHRQFVCRFVNEAEGVAAP